MTPKSRYIIFTDAMLRHLDLSEIKAVLAHELGHGKQKHLLLYLLFSMAFLFALSLSENLLPPFSSVKEEIVIMLVLVGPAMILYWWLVFGFLSRRFETEADFVGALALKDPELFIRTLDKVALVGRVERRRSSWRHFSIDRRTANLRKFIFEDPAAARVREYVVSGIVTGPAGAWRMVFDGRYKLVRRGEGDADMLFDLADDPFEETDIAGDRPETVGELAGGLPEYEAMTPQPYVIARPDPLDSGAWFVHAGARSSVTSPVYSVELHHNSKKIPKEILKGGRNE